jgi:hypothetical protein
MLRNNNCTNIVVKESFQNAIYLIYILSYLTALCLEVTPLITLKYTIMFGVTLPNDINISTMKINIKNYDKFEIMYSCREPFKTIKILHLISQYIFSLSLTVTKKKYIHKELRSP